MNILFTGGHPLNACMPGHPQTDSAAIQISVSGVTADMFDCLRVGRTGLFDCFPMGCLTLDAQGRVVEINRVAAGILGGTRNQLQGENFFSLLDPGEVKILERNGKPLQGMGNGSQISLLVRSTGGMTWIKAGVMEMGDSNNSGLCLIFTDTTTQKQTEKELGWHLRVTMAMDIITDALSQPGPDFNSICRTILTIAADLTQSANGFIARFSKNAHPSAHMIFDQIYPEKCRMEAQHMTLALDDQRNFSGLLGRALNSGKPFFTTTSFSSSAVAKLPDGHIPVQGFLAVPLIFNHQPVGLLVLANPENPYSQEMVKLVTRLAKMYTIGLKLKLSG
jgi:PAS domain S-box-containing protein